MRAGGRPGLDLKSRAGLDHGPGITLAGKCGLTRTWSRSWARLSGRRHVARRSWAARLGSAASCWLGSMAGSFGLNVSGFVGLILLVILTQMTYLPTKQIKLN